MELTINKEKHIFKDFITFGEESDVDILSSLLPILMKGEDDDLLEKGFMELVMSKDFRARGNKLIHYMSLEPKLSVEKINDMKSHEVLMLMVECLKAYASSFGKSFDTKDATEKKSLASVTLPSPLKHS